MNVDAWHVERAGAGGEPLLLVHGIGHSGAGWGPVARRLGERFDVFAPDSPGFGASAPLPAGTDPTIDAYADAFAALIGRLGLERPHVAGNSMGGGIALELARRGAVRSATALSPVGFWSDGERRYAQGSLRVTTGIPSAARPAVLALTCSALGRRALFAQLFARPGLMPAEEARRLLVDAWNAPSFAAALAAFDRYDFAGGDALFPTPVTVAWGSKDRLLLFASQSRRARDRLPWARHVTLPGLGHTPFFDDPGQVAEVVRAGTVAGV